MNINSMLLLAEVCGGAVLSAVVAYKLQDSAVPTQEPASAEVVAVPEYEPEPTVVLMSPETIVGHGARPRPVLTVLPVPPTPDPPALKCSGWTNLTQGAIGQQVRYCE